MLIYTWIHCFDQQKAAWFEIDLCVSCASYVATLVTIENYPFFAHQNFTNVTTPYKRSMLFGKKKKNTPWLFKMGQNRHFVFFTKKAFITICNLYIQTENG